MKKLIVLLISLIVFSNLYAINDHPTSGCNGVHDFNHIHFFEFYWKEGSQWYKIPSSQMTSIYPWKCMLDNSCGGNAPWGDPYTCYISGHTNNGYAVDTSAVPCDAPDHFVYKSCWVWKNIALNSDTSGMYRINPPNGHSNYMHAWYNYMTLYSQRVPDSSIEVLWYSTTSGWPVPITMWHAETRWDVSNHQENWPPSDDHWSIHTNATQYSVEKRFRFYLWGNWVYYWSPVHNLSNAFKAFQMSIQKGHGANPLNNSFDESEFERSDYGVDNDVNDHLKGIDLRLSDIIEIYDVNSVLKDIFVSASEELSTSLKFEVFSDGTLAELTVERIDKKHKNESNGLLEGTKIVGINGYRLEEFENIENFFNYISKETVNSITFLVNDAALYTIFEK